MAKFLFNCSICNEPIFIFEGNGNIIFTTEYLLEKIDEHNQHANHNRIIIENG